MIAKRIRRRIGRICIAAMALLVPAAPCSADVTSEPAAPENPTSKSDALTNKVRESIADHEYRTAITALDELLVQPGAIYSIPLQEANTKFWRDSSIAS